MCVRFCLYAYKNPTDTSQNPTEITCTQLFTRKYIYQGGETPQTTPLKLQPEYTRIYVKTGGM